MVLFHRSEESLPEKYHLQLNFNDGTFLTVRLTSMGCIQVFGDDNLERSYVYVRDHMSKLDPMDEGEFTFVRFSDLLQSQARMLKSVLLGKDAIIVGVSNSAFQEIAYKAKIHPKRKASDLDGNERLVLYDSIRGILGERIRLKGKEGFVDLYGNPGGYKPVMASDMMGKPCPECGTAIEKLAIAGGPSYFCPHCQK